MPMPPPIAPTAGSERVTLTYAWRGELPLKVDIYPFATPFVATSTASSFPPPSPFVLFLHSSPTNPGFSGSRAIVPPWLLTTCSKRGWPLLSADYRLAPEATLSHSWQDIQSLWSFIADEAGLNWSLMSTGAGSEADTGTHTLGPGFVALQQRAGVDVSKAIIVAGGGSAYLGAIGGALLKPAPAALVLSTPILDVSTAFYTSPRPPLPTSSTTKRKVKRLQGVLSRAGRVEQAIAAASSSSPPGYGDPTSPKNSDPWWRSRMVKRDVVSSRHGRERAGLYEAVLRSGQLTVLLDPPYPLEEALTHRHSNVPYPPILLLSGEKDSLVDPTGPRNMIHLLRSKEPASALLDDLQAASLTKQRRKQSTTDHPLEDGEELFDPARRFLHRSVRRGGHAFDVQAIRDDNLLIGHLDATEAFLSTWLTYAAQRPTQMYQNQNGPHQRRRRTEKL